MVALNVSLATLSIGSGKIEITRLAGQLPVLFQRLFTFALD